MVLIALGCGFDDWAYRPFSNERRVTGAVGGVSSHVGTQLRVTGGFDAPMRRCGGGWCVTGRAGP